MGNATPLKARPTVYKGVQMRSRMEAGFAQWCDRSALHWQYEPSAFASERGQYLPDFLVHVPVCLGGNVSMRVAYVEVKPDAVFLGEDFHAITDRMAIVFDSEPRTCLLAVTERATYFVTLSATGPDICAARWVWGPPPVLAIDLFEGELPLAPGYWEGPH